MRFDFTREQEKFRREARESVEARTDRRSVPYRERKPDLHLIPSMVIQMRSIRGRPRPAEVKASKYPSILQSVQVSYLACFACKPIAGQEAFIGAHYQ